MDVVVDFLLEYYVWILVILVILLITVIGFLVDTRRKKKKRENMDNQLSGASQNMEIVNDNMNGVMTNQNMNGFNMQMNTGLNGFDNSFNNNMNGPVSAQNLNNFDTSMNNFNNMNNGMLNQNYNMMNQNMDNSLNNVNNDTFFSPTSEQIPTFEPRNVVIPKPVESTPIMNFGSTPSPVVEPVPVAEPSMSQNMAFGGPQVTDMSSTVQGISPVMPNTNTIPNTNVNLGFNEMVGRAQNVVPTPVVESVSNAVSNMNTEGTQPVNPIPNVAEVPSVNPIPNMNVNLGVNEAANPIPTPVVEPNINSILSMNGDGTQTVTPKANETTNTNATQVVMPSMNMGNTPVANGVPFESQNLEMNMNNNVVGGSNVNLGTMPTSNNQMPMGNDNWQL